MLAPLLPGGEVVAVAVLVPAVTPCAGGEVAGDTESIWTLVVEIYSALREHHSTILTPT